VLRREILAIVAPECISLCAELMQLASLCPRCTSPASTALRVHVHVQGDPSTSGEAAEADDPGERVHWTKRWVRHHAQFPLSFIAHEFGPKTMLPGATCPTAPYVPKAEYEPLMPLMPLMPLKLCSLVLHAPLPLM